MFSLAAEALHTGQEITHLRDSKCNAFGGIAPASQTPAATHLLLMIPTLIAYPPVIRLWRLCPLPLIPFPFMAGVSLAPLKRPLRPF